MQPFDERLYHANALKSRGTKITTTTISKKWSGRCKTVFIHLVAHVQWVYVIDATNRGVSNRMSLFSVWIGHTVIFIKKRTKTQQTHSPRNGIKERLSLNHRFWIRWTLLGEHFYILMTNVNASKSHIRDESYLNLDCGFSEDAPFLSFPRVEKSNGKWDTHKFASQISTASEFQPIFGKNPCQKI